MTRRLRNIVRRPDKSADPPDEDAPRDGPRKRGGAVRSVLAVLLGVALGLGLFTFGYADGASYLGDDPATCANCHVMKENYNSYLKSSHGKVATCNDCHTPHNLVGKYVTKAQNGFSHSLAFTTQRFPDEIQITKRSLKVTEGTCLSCHKDVVTGIQATRSHDQKISCVECHRTVGHM
ncbi:cytochrome c nitrite reductase small subunit [Micromonospora sonneratiae]|uniref:Cytochrome c nitrite reductase small subunit n=1 Tax=Micromonospora sonneratiae TaxID=1184706 RepID=A0ABW3YCR6_9ACTN